MSHLSPAPAPVPTLQPATARHVATESNVQLLLLLQGRPVSACSAAEAAEAVVVARLGNCRHLLRPVQAARVTASQATGCCGMRGLAGT